ncbi:unnamed protein product [Medioppia subpectinata]|uniref:Uncharacterized protein n=1 Tax=Medioppia subpectinata TaxID=1979941 RepID=A0A7R9QCH0_9ACAR|nr:unnamed protein product [Medioppia subpectinata]CAG2118389.1 unnamed protein product [Medioppia subpectinata]
MDDVKTPGDNNIDISEMSLMSANIATISGNEYSGYVGHGVQGMAYVCDCNAKQAYDWIFTFMLNYTVLLLQTNK